MAIYDQQENSLESAVRLINSLEADRGEEDTNFLAAVGYSTLGAATSAAAQLYDIPASIGNLFGVEEELTDIEGVIANNFGYKASEFYSRNKDIVDVVGFVASSFVPGMAGVKALTAGQKALRTAAKGVEVHPFIKSATKLAAPNVPAYLTEVKATALLGQANSMARAESLKAIAAGGTQFALETIAFEAAATMAMSNGEVLGDLTTKQLITEAAFGTLIGGAIGGAVTGFAVRGANKIGLSHNADVWNKYSVTEEITSGTDDFLRAHHYLRKLKETETNLTTKTIEEDVIANFSELGSERQAQIKSALGAKLTQMKTSYKNSAIEAITDLAKGDAVASKALFKKFEEADMEDVTSILAALDEIVPAGKLSKVEGKISKEIRALKDSLEFSDAEYKTIYVDMATMEELEKPLYISITDTGSKLEVKGSQVYVGRDSYKITNDLNINPMETGLATPRELEARSYFFSRQKNSVFTKADSILYEDVPVLDEVIKRIGAGSLTAYSFKKTNGILKLRNRKGEVTSYDLNLADDITNLKKDVAVTKLGLVNKYVNHKGDLQVKGFSSSDKAEYLSKITGHNVESVSLPKSIRGVYYPATNRIGLNSYRLPKMSLTEAMGVILHEVGHKTDKAVTGFRYSSSSITPEAQKELIALSKLARKEHWKGVAAIKKKKNAGRTLTAEEKEFLAYMTNMDELMADARAMLSVLPEDKLPRYKNLVNLFGSNLYRVQDDLARLHGYNVETAVPNEAIARGLNISPKVLNDTASATADDFLYRQTRAAKLEVEDEYSIPLTHKLTYDSSKVKMSLNEARGFGQLETLANAHRQETSAVADKVIGSLADKLPSNDGDVLKVYQNTVDAEGTGGKFLAASNRDYGNFGSFTKWIGGVVTKSKEAAARTISEELAPAVHSLTSNPNVARAYGILDNQLRKTSHVYKLDKNAKAMVSETATRVHYLANLVDNPNDVEALVKLIDSHIKRNDINITNKVKLDNVMGRDTGNLTDKEGSYYPLPPDTRGKPYVAYVFDNSIASGRKHSSMIYAASEKELNRIRGEIEAHPEFNGTVTVRTTSEVEDYYKSIHELDASKRYDSAALRGNLQRLGLDAPFEAVTDGKTLAENLVNFHVNSAKANITNAIEVKYSGIMNSLNRLAETHSTKPLIGSGKEKDFNPYESYIKEMLGFSTASQYKTWAKASQVVENIFNSVHDAVFSDILRKGSITEDDLLKANDLLKKNGYQGAFVSPMTMELTNRRVETHTASKFVSIVNSALSFFVLRSDPLHAINNLIGHNVMFGGELTDVVRRIGAADPKSRVFKDLNLTMPGGKASINPTKIVNQAIKDFYGRGDLRRLYSDLGYHLDVSQQLRAFINEAAIDVGQETTESIITKTSKLKEMVTGAGSFIERKSLNRFSEEFTNFVTARTMHIIAEEAARVGAISKDSIWTYVNTFTNRVRGTYIAAQRPALFQGAIGMSMSLFQTYQLNLIQQLFRYTAEGRLKASTALLGLQTSIYGAQGLPGYRAVNSYVANVEGNTDKSDITGSTYRLFGTEGADWLMYGLASNATTIFGLEGINLYTRGDLNPREITVIPVNPLDAPWFSGWSKFLGNLAEAGSKLSNGADAYDTITRALEHNGLSRPLSGLGKVLQGLSNPELQGYSTSNSGKQLASFDLASFTTLINLAGGKALSEAKAIDALYRQKAYKAEYVEDMASLKELIRLHGANNEGFDMDVYENFAHKYASTGGDMIRYRQFFMSALKEAREPTLDALANFNGSQYGRDFQAIVGGDVQ